MRLSVLKPNFRGLYLFISVALPLFLPFFIFGTSSVLFILIPLAILWYIVSIYVGTTFKSQKTDWSAALSRTAVFIPAFVGLVIIAYFEIHTFCFYPLFYFILAFSVSIPIFILLLAKLKKFQPALFIVVIVVILGFACYAFVEIHVARPLILLAYLIFALVLSLPLFVLISAPFHRAILIPYLLFITIVIVVNSVPWTSRHHFLRNLGRIRAGRYLDREESGIIFLARRHGPGMTFADVEQIMQGYPLMVNGKGYRPLKKLYNPKVPFQADYVSDPNARKELWIIDGRASYRHSGEWFYNADFGWVDFEDGHVVRTLFLPD